MNSNTPISTDPVTTADKPQLPVMTSEDPANWKGMTLEQLKRARGKALVRRELGRASLQYDLEGVKANVATNGVRALMFRPSTVSHLKTADYVLLGFRLARWLLSMRGNRRRR